MCASITRLLVTVLTLQLGLASPVGAQLAGGGGQIAHSALPFGVPISPPKPDTVQGFYVLTTRAGSAELRLDGAAFKATDVGKLIVCTGIGPTEGRLTTSIKTVSDATRITLAATATQSMTRVSQRCVYGSDQASAIQAAFTYGTNNNIGSFVQGGLYLIGSPLTCLPPPANNSLNAPGPMCQLDYGATLMAMSPMTSMITYGSADPDYSGYLRNVTFGGGTLDGNFIADYGADIPFYIVATRHNQVTKNTKLAGVRWGRMGAPAPSSSSQDINVGHLRDVYYITVTGITNSARPVVTTQWAHGFSTGRIVTLVGVSGMTEANFKFFKITVTGPNTFALDNTDSSAWGAFGSTARVAVTMPSMRMPYFITGITNANPAVVSTALPHGFANGALVWLAGVSGVNLGGIYTVANATSTTFELQRVDTTALGEYAGNGAVVEYVAPTSVEKGIYYENATDADVTVAQVTGVRYGIYANPATGGYDSKIIKPHFFNYNENGEMFAGIEMVGDNTIQGAQFDAPIRYAMKFSGPRNTVIGSRLTYLGHSVLFNNYSSFIRLDMGGEANVLGGGMKGTTSSAVLGELSQNGASFGRTPGYSRLGVKTQYTSLVQPDASIAGTFNVLNYSGGASTQVTGTGPTTVLICDRTAGQGGLSLSTSPDGASLHTIDSSCSRIANPMSVVGNDVLMKNLPRRCTGKTTGTLWQDGDTLKVCP